MKDKSILLRTFLSHGSWGRNTLPLDKVEPNTLAVISQKLSKLGEKNDIAVVTHVTSEKQVISLTACGILIINNGKDDFVLYENIKSVELPASAKIDEDAKINNNKILVYLKDKSASLELNLEAGPPLYGCLNLLKKSQVLNAING